MIAYTFKEILLSVFSFLSFGIIFGILYSVSDLFCRICGKLVLLVPTAYISLAKKQKGSSVSIKKKSKNKILRNIYEATVFLVVGGVLVLLYYVYLDSMFRIYPIIFFSVGFYTAKRYVGDFCYKFLMLAFEKFYIILLFIAKYAVAPIFYILDFLKKMLCKILYPLRTLYIGYSSKRIIRIKQKETRYLFNVFESKIRLT